MMTKNNKLSKREKDVAELLMQSKSNKQIAFALVVLRVLLNFKRGQGFFH
jgi:FixJ family two-component response regulator